MTAALKVAMMMLPIGPTYTLATQSLYRLLGRSIALVMMIMRQCVQCTIVNGINNKTQIVGFIRMSVHDNE